jgi:hypothetical protein
LTNRIGSSNESQLSIPLQPRIKVLLHLYPLIWQELSLVAVEVSERVVTRVVTAVLLLVDEASQGRMRTREEKMSEKVDREGCPLLEIWLGERAFHLAILHFEGS